MISKGTDMLTEADLQARRGRISGSTLAGVAGVSYRMTPLEAYLLIVGEYTVEENDAMEWGHRLEAPVADKYADVHGVELEEVGTQISFRHDWLCSTPDRLVKGMKRGLEVKTTAKHLGWRWGPSGSDEYPAEAHVQCAANMAVLEYDEWDLAVLIGGQDYREYRIHRDLEFENDLIALGERFMEEHVRPRVAPPNDGSEAASEWKAKRYAAVLTHDLIQADEAIEQMALEYKKAIETAKDAAENKKRIQQDLQDVIGHAEGVQGSFGKIYWKADKQGKTAWKKVAEHLGATAEVIEQFRSKPGRVFRPYFTD